MRDRATAALWPDLDASAATSQLYKALHHIRKAFAQETEGADEWIEMTDDLVRFAVPGRVSVDVHQFEEQAHAGLRDHRVRALEMAVSTYVGDLLPMDRYAEWASLPREHCRQLYLDVLTTLAGQYEQRGELSKATQMLRLALEKDPALESSHRALMRIFARQGQPTRAFRQYDLCREVLHRELAMGPSPKTKETLESVQEQRLATDADPISLRATTPAPRAPLIGRVEERAALSQTLDQLSSGAGAVLLVRGRKGLGKTRLIQELALRARQRSFRVFSGGSQETDGGIAYGPFVEVFEEVLRENPSLQELLPEELGQLVPSFSGDGIPVPHADRRAARGYLFAQVQRVLSRLAEDGPVVVVLEDLHAADEGSRELFSYLARHAREQPVLLVATTRNENDDLVPQQAAAEEPPSNTILDLDPLTAEEHALLLQQHARSTVSEETADRIFHLSEGNPFFALELLRTRLEQGKLPAADEEDPSSTVFAASSEPLPSSLRHVVEEQVNALSSPARHLLYIAAVIGRDVPYDLLASVWREGTVSEEDGIFDPLEELIDAHLLDESGLDYSFRHALMREGIYTCISEARRRTLHFLAARRLAAMADEEDEPPVEQIAHHFLRAGEVRQGVHYLLRAGERAEAAYAHDDALRHYQRAHSEVKSIEENWARRVQRDMLERIGDVYRACGRLERSYDAYEDAVALSEEVPLGRPDQVELHRKIALVAIFRTEMDRSERHLCRAFDLVDDDARARARLLIMRALHFWHLNRLEDAYDVARTALDRAETVDASVEASQACEILAMTCLPLGRWEEGLEYEMRRQVHGWSPEIVVATDAHLCLWEYHVTGDQPFERAQSFLQGVAEQASELGDRRCVAVCHYALGTMHLWRGQSRAAVEELDASLELHEQVGSPAGMAYVQARKGVLHTMEGATERGWQVVQDGIENADRVAVRDHCLQRLYGVGLWNRLEAEDRSGTRTLVDRSENLLDEAGACGACALELHPWLAYFHLRSGQLERVRACRDTLAALAEKTGNPIGEALATMIESSLLVAKNDDERAERRRREAFEQIEEAVTETVHSPVVHYLDRMADQQSHLRTVTA